MRKLVCLLPHGVCGICRWVVSGRERSIVREPARSSRASAAGLSSAQTTNLRASVACTCTVQCVRSFGRRTALQYD